MLSMKKLTFVAEDWQMPCYHLSIRCCSALANEFPLPADLQIHVGSAKGTVFATKECLQRGMSKRTLRYVQD